MGCSALPAPQPIRLAWPKLGAAGVVYHGMALLGGGAVLAGLILGAIAAFIIDRKFE